MTSSTSTSTAILASSVGNALEWYDFGLFGYFAPQIARVFFPAHDPTASLVLAYATFGVSFLARPAGAAMLGAYADRRGRRPALTASILLMTLGTALMVITPGYATIGVLAPLGILLARLIQGFSAGGEFGGATAFMIEHAPHRPGFFASFQFTSQAVAQAASALVGLAVGAALSRTALDAWGFRLPFALGLLIGPVGLWLRRHVPESPAFDGTTPEAHPFRALLARVPLRVVLGAGVIAAGTASTYLRVYLPSYAETVLHLTVRSSFAASLAGWLMAIVVTPLVAHWSDIVGRLRLMLTMAVLLTVSAWPAFLLLAAHPSFAVLTGVTLVTGLLQAAYTAPAPALLAELFPTRLRGVGMSLAYTAGVTLFGGFAPAINTWLVHRTGNASAPGAYLLACGVLTIVSLLCIARLRSAEQAL